MSSQQHALPTTLLQCGQTCNMRHEAEECKFVGHVVCVHGKSTFVTMWVCVQGKIIVLLQCGSLSLPWLSLTLGSRLLGSHTRLLSYSHM